MTTEARLEPRAPIDDRVLNAMLWVAQIILAGVFAAGGVLRLGLPIYVLRNALVWPDEIYAPYVRWEGFFMVLIAAALVIARPIRKLVPGTAVGVAMIMVVLTASHILKSQPGRLLLDAWLAGLAAFVAWGRAQRLPF